ncbi:fatty acid CoA ligase FadD9 [Mycolicibacterium sp. BK634]|uniref:carboxylic acid reductase n=1 Tax=Mycolicibacterium sp. BK634 TaxID=2587099 RepID=UPI001612FF47|nr:carboxylic acid reductase [Mycolicibacterium sp. BK634]MBB3748711.1 fatty acid CoA ligase FadD9 [Mycolicibacterium sp. BK634]
MAFVGRSDVKDPGAQQEQWDRIARRRERLYAEDIQFAAAKPDDDVAAAARQPGLRIAQVMATVMEGYADRPALGARARDLTTDPATGQTEVHFLPEFVTTSYRQLWDRVRVVAADWHHHPEHPLMTGDFVCVLGFASVDYAVIELACIHLGAVVVPLQTSAPATQHAPILTETGPRILLASIESLDTAVEALLLGAAPQRLIVFDYEPRDDTHRARFDGAVQRLADADSPLVIEVLDGIADSAVDLPAAPLHVAADGEDPLAWVFYTSGTTGTPKGAMLTESLCIGSWLAQSDQPVITLSYMPMSHLIGYGYVLMTLANGGTSYFAASSDLSTLFDDLAAARPTTLSLVPRVCEMFYHHYLGELDKAAIAGADEQEAGERLREDLRERVLGGRVLACGCGSAALSPEIKDFMESVLDQHLMIGYSSTEIAGGMLLADEHVLRPPVIDYKLDDVPELGYFNTDKPYPRGELLVKSQRFMAGYYKRPDLTATMYDAQGYYRTGDIMAEVAPDRLRFVDRRNNVIKLSQGEFVAVARLEALYTKSPLIRQIYLYGTSERAFLLGIVVPTDPSSSASAIAESLLEIAHENQLNSYEIPRDLLIETEPFSLANGLLSGVGKFLRPNLKERYGPRLEERYAELADNQARQLRALRAEGTALPIDEVVARAVQATLGLSADNIDPTARFIDLGGDSLSALTISRLLADIVGAEVPVGVVTDPTGSLASVAAFIERQRNSASKMTFGSVHGAGAREIRAADLALDKFIDTEILQAATTLRRPAEEIRSVLVTGVTGFLGRFLGLEWLERMAAVDGRVTYLARGADAAGARARIEAALESDPALLQRFRDLADGHLEIIASDIGEPGWGLDDATWARLAESVDLIVHPAAHVNHVLPYDQLFAPNVAGTAELIRLALTTKLKTIHYISTMGVTAVADHIVGEERDIRLEVPVVSLSAGYANGYGVSKWASEVLLREAHDLCALPVAVFRPGMILADSRYDGQLNVPDIFTRLLFSVIATGVAPASFYLGDASRAHYEGLPVDFLAGAIAEVGLRGGDAFVTYNTTNPHDDGASLDSFVDWITDSGFPVQRIDDYAEWLARFETAMQALPERAKQQSVLTVLDVYRHPGAAVPGSLVPAARFRAAVESAGREIPGISRELIAKYVDDMRLLDML